MARTQVAESKQEARMGKLRTLAMTWEPAVEPRDFYGLSARTRPGLQVWVGRPSGRGKEEMDSARQFLTCSVCSINLTQHLAFPSINPHSVIQTNYKRAFVIFI